MDSHDKSTAESDDPPHLNMDRQGGWPILLYILKHFRPPKRPDPYKYLINLSLNPQHRPDLLTSVLRLPMSVKADDGRFSPSVQAYLRLLGRTDTVQDLIPRPSEATIANLELAGG